MAHEPAKAGLPVPSRMSVYRVLVRLPRNEISRLLAAVISQPPSQARQLHWSAWRRRHQHRAKTSPYQRRASLEP